MTGGDVDVDERKESEQIEISFMKIRLGMPYFPSNSSGAIQYLQANSHFTSLPPLKIKSLLLQCNY
jgi:hypothetical protein